MTNLIKIAEDLSSLTLIEAAELSKILEEKWGVSATTPLVSEGVKAVVDTEAPVEKTEFDITLVSVGEKKINVIKAVRSITGLGLKEAKGLVDSAPSPIKEGISKDEADKIKTDLEASGATVKVN